MNQKNLCKDCPKEVKGKCCFYNIELEGYNIILRNQPCKYLNLKTMECSDYEHRLQINPYCHHSGDMYNFGGLPKGCLYLKDHPELEENPKIDISEVINKITPQSIMEYNVWNNVANIERFAIKRKD